MILIFSDTGDKHSYIVDKGLRQIGEETCHVAYSRLFSDDNPTININDDALQLNIDGKTIKNLPDTTVWYRRQPSSFVTPENMLPEDEWFFNESANYFCGSMSTLFNESFCVNPFKSLGRMANKAIQISLAKETGFFVPNTIITSDPAYVSSFRKQYDTVCVKYLVWMTWGSGTKTRATFTAKIEKNEILESSQIRNSISIFQPFIKKQYEVRITVFGHYMQAVKIPQGVGVDPVDWRKNLNYLAHIKKIKIPYEIREKIIFLMKRMNINFGAFDFIIDKDQKWWFLEVNESGTFLWKQDNCRDINLFAPFVLFLKERNPEFLWDDCRYPDNLDYQKIQSLADNDPQYTRFLSYGFPQPFNKPSQKQ
ncbi:hypothetical protein NKW55_15535 [Gluconobacter kondonii]|uniref:hypothetical protein n=1 Tax=Gluconobacter kondonii TaxID=941463 RepID=UPI0020A15CF5|nr:hypothetical protein [Gluconobacter kondonii]MCP1237954.1 hypothetical protein [Gluconobacter kondonii]